MNPRNDVLTLEAMASPVKNEIFVPASPTDVWRKVADVERWGAWRKVDPKAWKAGAAPLEVGSAFGWVAGYNVSATVTECVEGRVLTWKGSVLLGSVRAHHRWLFAPEGAGCRVTVEEEMGGLLGKCMLSDEALSALNDEWLAELRASFEAKK